jgi:hypothetical protein
MRRVSVYVVKHGWEEQNIAIMLTGLQAKPQLPVSPYTTAMCHSLAVQQQEGRYLFVERQSIF